MTCALTHTVTQADLNSGNVHDVACANAPGATQACAPDDVPGAPPANVGQITPTGTTCNQFRDNQASTLSQLNYSINNQGKVSAVNPGVLFYWIKVATVAG